MSASRLDTVNQLLGHVSSRPLPEHVLDMAKRCFVDWFAVSLAALDDEGPALVRQQMQQWGTQGRALSLYGDRGTPAAMALINATLAHSLDYDDMHYGSAFHASGPTVAAALAVGLQHVSSELDVLRAFVAGFELGATLGEDGTGPRLAAAGWHPTGVLGHLSAAATSALLMRLTPEQTVHAVGLAATQVAGLQASGGTMAKPFHVGKAAMNGVMAAELAALGAKANTRMLDDERGGLLGTLLQQPALARLAVPGERWQIEGNTFKPYAACQLTHAAHEAGADLAGRFTLDGLGEVRIHVHPLSPKVANRTSADTALEGKFCLGYCVGLGLLGQVADLSGFTAARIDDPTLRRLTSLARVTAEDDLERSAARVELVYDDGRVVTGRTDAVLGSPQRPLSWADLEAKFIAATAEPLGNVAPQWLAVLRQFERPGSLQRLQALWPSHPAKATRAG